MNNEAIRHARLNEKLDRAIEVKIDRPARFYIGEGMSSDSAEVRFRLEGEHGISNRAVLYVSDREAQVLVDRGNDELERRGMLLPFAEKIYY